MTIPDGTEEGYYWVRCQEKWWIADLSNAWYTQKRRWDIEILEHIDSPFREEQIDELGPRILPPDQQATTQCGTCDGTGKVDYAAPGKTQCEECKGSGEVPA